MECLVRVGSLKHFVRVRVVLLRVIRLYLLLLLCVCLQQTAIALLINVIHLLCLIIFLSNSGFLRRMVSLAVRKTNYSSGKRSCRNFLTALVQCFYSLQLDYKTILFLPFADVVCFVKCECIVSLVRGATVTNNERRQSRRPDNTKLHFFGRNIHLILCVCAIRSVNVLFFGC